MTATERAEARKARIAQERQERRGEGSLERAMRRQTIAAGPTFRKPKVILRKLTIPEHFDRANHTQTVRRVS